MLLSPWLLYDQGFLLASSTSETPLNVIRSTCPSPTLKSKPWMARQLLKYLISAIHISLIQ